MKNYRTSGFIVAISRNFAVQSVRDCLPLTATDKTYFGEANEQELSEKNGLRLCTANEKREFYFFEQEIRTAGTNGAVRRLNYGNIQQL